VKRAVSATADVPATSVESEAANSLLGRRMVVMLFDVSSMQPEDIQRAVEDAREHVDDTMTDSDLVAVVTIGSRLNVLTDFTSSKEDLQAALQSLAYSNGTEIDLGAIATAATEAETTSEATEASAFEEFNNDVRLRALKTLCETISPIQQKKAVMYFSSGIRRSGDDNNIEVRAASNTCNRANVNIYPVDARGLQAVVAGGGASQRGSGGQGLFTGQNATRGFASLNASQDTLVTLAADTGGRAFTSSNDFGEAFARVQRDLAAYYLLGYSSTNPAQDGRFRRIEVRVNRKDLGGVRIEARNGYYARRSFANTNRGDRQTQLEDQLAAAVSNTDVPVVLGTGFFRQTNDRFYVPIAMVVPGSSVPVATGATKVTLDVLGHVLDEQGRTVGRIKETIDVPTTAGSETLAGRQVLYQSGVSLPPGHFSVKVVVRENTGGGIGSFEAPINVPQLRDESMKVSSVVMSTQVKKADGGKSDSPLVRDGLELLPNLTRVVARNQSVYFYYEVYDPKIVEQAPQLRTSMAFYRGNVKVFETPMVEKTTVDDSNRKAAVFQFEVPANQFKPGSYTCQINIIDAVASQVSFPRVSFVVLE
jgi:VWFA-related protein